MHTDEVTVNVVEAASDALETPIEELPPLSESVDIDALNAIIPLTPTGQPPSVTVTFTYAGLSVAVRAGNIVSVLPIRGEQRGTSGPRSFR